MITDDPGTPGNGHWENNLAIAFEHRPNEWSIDAPGIDLNYGLGDHIQLTLQTSLAILKRSDHGALAGIGGTEAAVKWRFLDEEKAGLDVSMFPRIIFNVAQSSVRRGLSEDGTRFQIPFQLAKKFGPIDLDFEFVARSQHVVLVAQQNFPSLSGLKRILDLLAQRELAFSADSSIRGLVGFRERRNRSPAMAVSGHRNDRPCRWHGHLCIHDRYRLVGSRRAASRAVLHARSR